MENRLQELCRLYYESLAAEGGVRRDKIGAWSQACVTLAGVIAPVGSPDWTLADKLIWRYQQLDLIYWTCPVLGAAGKATLDKQASVITRLEKIRERNQRKGAK